MQKVNNSNGTREKRTKNRGRDLIFCLKLAADLGHVLSIVLISFTARFKVRHQNTKATTTTMIIVILKNKRTSEITRKVSEFCFETCHYSSDKLPK